MIKTTDMAAIQRNSLQNISPRSIEQKSKPEFQENSSFVQILKDSIYDVDQATKGADSLISSFATGKNSDIHQTMVAIEKADISFQLMSQIRNKIIAAYQEVYRMQV